MLECLKFSRDFVKSPPTLLPVFLLYFLQIASVHDFWMEENLLKRFYKLLNWSCSTLIEHFRCTFTWENHLLLCHLNPQGPLIEEKCEENWAPLLIIIFVMVSFEVYLNFEMSDWLITVMIMLMKNASDSSLEKVMIRHQIFRFFWIFILFKFLMKKCWIGMHSVWKSLKKSHSKFICKLFKNDFSCCFLISTYFSKSLFRLFHRPQ